MSFPLMRASIWRSITAREATSGMWPAGVFSISAAGSQEEVKKGFGPMVAGFRQVPFNDLDAMRAATTPQSAAILVEAIQGESGITLATADYLLGLRKLCDDNKLLLLLDEVQAAH